MGNLGGIFSKVNSALPTGERNNILAGLHRVKILSVQFKDGTAKNAGKLFFICECEVVKTSIKDNVHFQPGSKFGIVFDTAKYPDSAVADIKAFLLAQFSEEEMTRIPRNILKADEVQEDAGNPYKGQQVGITFQEALKLIQREGDDSPYKQSDVLIDVEAVDKPLKSDPNRKFTKCYYKKAGTLTQLDAA